jgi:hypothetical protein
MRRKEMATQIMEEKTAIAMLNSRPETVFLNFKEPRNRFQGIDSSIRRNRFRQPL